MTEHTSPQRTCAASTARDAREKICLEMRDFCIALLCVLSAYHCNTLRVLSDGSGLSHWAVKHKHELEQETIKGTCTGVQALSEQNNSVTKDRTPLCTSTSVVIIMYLGPASTWCMAPRTGTMPSWLT